MSASDVAIGDPSDDDFDGQALVALQELEKLKRNSFREDRAKIRDDLKLPNAVFSYLGKRGAIQDVVGGKDDERTITEKGTKFLTDPQAWKIHRYHKEVNRALKEFAAKHTLPVDLKRPHVIESRDKWKLNLWEPLQNAIDVNKSDRHRWIHNLRSSQAFALNMFGPLKKRMPWALEVWSKIFPGVTAVEFEYPQSGDPLAETSKIRKSRTRIDARIDYGAAHIALVEVKLTELEFGGCTAWREEENPYKAQSCDAPFNSFTELEQNCYLCREAKRTYFSMLSKPGSLIDEAKIKKYGEKQCPFRGGLYQLMRNLLMVQYLRSTEPPKDVTLVVLSPGKSLNPYLHEHVSDLIPGALTQHDSVLVLSFEEIVMASSKLSDPQAMKWATYMTEKYVEPLKSAAAKCCR